MGDAPLTDTPEFIRWALARQCPLRDAADWESPERAERQLRSLQLYSEAVAENRLFEGVCVEALADPMQTPRRGFRASDVLSAYGGHEYVKQQCVSCPANAYRPNGRDSLAGCFGLFELSAIGEDLHALIEAAISTMRQSANFDAAFLATRPRWYGLWANSPLTETQIDLHLQLATSLGSLDARLTALLKNWLDALAAARAANLPLHVRLYPRGEIRDFRWTVVSHCPQCHVERSAQSRTCPVCGINAHATPPRKRHLRGSRPYWPLRGFMNEETTAQFLERYGRRVSGEGEGACLIIA